MELDLNNHATWPHTTEDGSKARDLEGGGKLYVAKDGTQTMTDKHDETKKMVRGE
jgi:hypothetical protein